MAVGTATNLVSDLSTRKATVFDDALSGRLPQTEFTSLGGVAQIELNTSDLSTSVKVLSSSGSPDEVVTATVGSMFLRTNGGANTTLYVKESGTGNTGWVAK